jgi:hypothetical protein
MDVKKMARDPVDRKSTRKETALRSGCMGAPRAGVTGVEIISHFR